MVDGGYRLQGTRCRGTGYRVQVASCRVQVAGVRHGV